MKLDDLYEMSNFSSRTTGLPDNISIWVRTDPYNHGHSKYRIKVTKNKEWVGIFLVGSTPKIIKNIDNLLTVQEIKIINEFIQKHFPKIINLIDGKIDSGEFTIAVQKDNG